MNGQRAAALTVCAHAADRIEARAFLSMLGLIDVTPAEDEAAETLDYMLAAGYARRIEAAVSS